MEARSRRRTESVATASCAWNRVACLDEYELKNINAAYAWDSRKSVLADSGFPENIRISLQECLGLFMRAAQTIYNNHFHRRPSRFGNSATSAAKKPDPPNPAVAGSTFSYAQDALVVCRGRIHGERRSLRQRLPTAPFPQPNWGHQHYSAYTRKQRGGRRRTSQDKQQEKVCRYKI